MLRAGTLNARAAPSPVGRLRVGLVVPRYKRTAVSRNRLKRRLRELIRHELLDLPIQRDVVIRTRPEAYAQPFSRLKQDIERLRAELLRHGGQV